MTRLPVPGSSNQIIALVGAGDAGHEPRANFFAILQEADAVRRFVGCRRRHMLDRLVDEIA